MENTGVALPHFQFRPSESAPTGEGVPFRLPPMKYLRQVYLRGRGFYGKVRLFGVEGTAIEGADILTDVAADDECRLAHRVMKLIRNFASFFEGKVADAASAIDGVGGDGIGGAGVDAAGAGAAVVGDGGIGGKVEVGDEFAEEEPGAFVGVNEEGVFSDPAEAGAGGEFALEDGAGIDVAAGD